MQSDQRLGRPEEGTPEALIALSRDSYKSATQSIGCWQVEFDGKTAYACIMRYTNDVKAVLQGLERLEPQRFQGKGKRELYQTK